MKNLAEQSTRPAKSRNFFRMLGASFRVMKRNDPLRMAGATAFFTCFALPPILIILFQIFSLFLGDRQIGSELREVLVGTFGTEGTAQIRSTIRGMRTFAGESYIAIGGFIFLIFVATTLFGVIKNSLNDIWGIRLKEKPGFMFNLWIRTRSFTAILLTGLLFVAAVLIDSLGTIAGEQIELAWPGKGKFFTGVWNEVAGLLVVITWFVILFRYLADGKPTWKNCIAGGTLTGIFYSAGKIALSSILKNSNMSSIYGASASLVLILLFVFYSSFILYYGAAFIRILSERGTTPIMPRNKAYRFEVLEVED